ncbi:alkaline shock response membrane anchor protein AmaP [Paenibacillus flagellatus]|uniref:Alkaline shock response membrane anchor protein AmaP n=1 Tax=Paenibacillus flagellatus TaxID=2211139 RepID=A0A2V5KAZ0_9BACL|nr:alkaline shock response membrane anchor protein AmaP [Paenibacillus flagellatus]PYI55053.1 alkaline shock response membrane anchor protein AmaP [Paenibacillus flagellatus]
MIKVLDRLLLFLYTLIIGIGVVFFLVASFGWLPIESAENFVSNLYYEGSTAYPAIAIGLFVLLATCRFFYVSVRRGRGQVPSIDQRTDVGDIRISLETVENLSLKAAGRVRGVKDLKARVSVNDAGLDIVLRAVVDGESSIPELSEEMQRSVKSHIEDITGIPVANVSVFIANVMQSSHTFKSRVE